MFLILQEICVVRFAPDTEEDEISYTLLYAYFSSRRRYGVVANNRRQVKDMYLIPLGSAEKIPHHIVPFDGPGEMFGPLGWWEFNGRWRLRNHKMNLIYTHIE